MLVIQHPLGLIIAIIPLILIQFGLMIYGLYDWFKQGPDLENRYLWLILIIVVNTIGPLIYFWKAPRGSVNI